MRHQQRIETIISEMLVRIPEVTSQAGNYTSADVLLGTYRRAFAAAAAAGRKGRAGQSEDTATASGCAVSSF